MSPDFAAQINRLATMVPTRKLSESQLDAIGAGRKFAEEFIAAARAGNLPPDGLMLAVRLLGATGKGYDQILRGFMQDLQKALAEVR